MKLSTWSKLNTTVWLILELGTACVLPPMVDNLWQCLGVLVLEGFFILMAVGNIYAADAQEEDKKEC